MAEKREIELKVLSSNVKMLLVSRENILAIYSPKKYIIPKAVSFRQ